MFQFEDLGDLLRTPASCPDVGGQGGEKAAFWRHLEYNILETYTQAVPVPLPTVWTYPQPGVLAP